MYFGRVTLAWNKIAEQGFAADCLQRPLRSRFRQQLKPGVRSGEWRS